jgi:hypothetical protein
MPKYEHMITFPHAISAAFRPEDQPRYGRYVGWRDTGKLSSLAKSTLHRHTIARSRPATSRERCWNDSTRKMITLCGKP